MFQNIMKNLEIFQINSLYHNFLKYFKNYSWSSFLLHCECTMDEKWMFIDEFHPQWCWQLNNDVSNEIVFVVNIKRKTLIFN
jgi:hypothetical protein